MKNVLLICDRNDSKFLPLVKENGHWNIFWEILDFNQLHKKIHLIKQICLEKKIDFILYSRNDQVGKGVRIGPVTKQIKVGYSSISGIDNGDRIEQMKTCFEDFLRCDYRLDFSIGENIRSKKRKDISKNGKGHFSLIFDTEQLGGVRYGLERIFNLLNKYEVKATFFVTNLMKKVYPDITNKIRELGHEVGIHGRWHEYLSKLSEAQQQNLIKDMITDFGGEIRGANFIGRMNKRTVHAMANNSIDYFVYPMFHHYKLFGYPKLPTTPFLMVSEKRKTWLIPISVETYNNHWFSIKHMIDSAITECSITNHHLSILMHPFRDGNLKHINEMEKILKFLILKNEMFPLTLGEMVERIEEDSMIKEIERIEDMRFKWMATPHNIKDIIGFIPENIMIAFKLTRRNKTLF